MDQYTEGQRLLGSDGQIYVVRNGVPLPEGGTTDTSRIIAPSPVRLAKEMQDRKRQEEQDARQREKDDRSARNEERRIALAEQAEARAATKGSDATGTTAKIRADAIAAYQAGEAIKQRVADMRNIFNAGPGATSGIQGLGDYLPTQANKAFDQAGNAVRGHVGTALGFTGGQLNSVAEAQMAVGPYLPQSSDYDENAIAKMDRLIDVANESQQRAVAVLGGVPDAAGNIVPGQAQQRADTEVPDPSVPADVKNTPDLNANDDPRYGTRQTIATGPTRTVTDPRMSAQVDAMLNAGASDALINAALVKQRFPPLNPGETTKARQWIKQNPGKRYYGADMFRTEDMSLLQRAASSAPAAAIAHSANNATAGLVGAMAGPDGQGALDAMSASSPWASGIGGISGGVAGSLGGGLAAVKAASRIAPKLAGAAPIVADMSYGAMLGGNTAREGEGGTGALTGAGAGLMGGLLGMGLGRTVSRFGAPKIAPEGRSILGAVKDDGTAIRAQLVDAQRLNVPMALADASPRLRTLGGAVSRKSVDARNLAETIFDPRALGQADRGVGYIDDILAPRVNLAERGAQHITDARTASNPLYEAAKARAAPIDDEVAAMLQTDAGRDALQRARSIASNEGRDPNAMGFDLDQSGEVVLRDAPSFETLDLVKRGLDARLEAARNPLTGQLDLTGNPELGAIEGLRKRFVAKLDTINDTYPQARAAYAERASLKDALERGYAAPVGTVRPRDLDAALPKLRPDQVPEFQSGYATRMGDQVEQVRQSANPFQSIYGSPAQQQKIGSVFPQGADDFARVNELERALQKTYTETLAGSPTAARLQADDQMNGGLGTVALDGMSQMVTGGGLGIGSLINAGRRMAGDSLKLGIGNQAVKRADAIAPVLYDTSPQVATDYLDELLATAAIRAARGKTAGQIGSGIGSGVLTPLLVGP